MQQITFLYGGILKIGCRETHRFIEALFSQHEHEETIDAKGHACRLVQVFQCLNKTLRHTGNPPVIPAQKVQFILKTPFLFTGIRQFGEPVCKLYS